MSSSLARVRQMREGDIRAVYEISSFSFAESDAEVLNRSPEEVEQRMDRYRHFLRYDPDGCFVAEEDGRVVGVAIALLREGLWVLSNFAVVKGSRGSGVGGALMKAALAHGEGCEAGMIASSTHPAAMRSYANAGFDLHPTFTAKGKVRMGEALTKLEVRAGNLVDDLGLAAEVDRYLRGASHGPDFEYGQRIGVRMLIAEQAAGRGYALLYEGSPAQVAATDPEVASDLLRACLAEANPEADVEVRWITARQNWAVRVVLAAGLDLYPDGPICIRGNPGPLTPYLPSGPFL